MLILCPFIRPMLCCLLPRSFLFGRSHWAPTIESLPQAGWRIQCCHLECHPCPSPPPSLKIAACFGNNSASLSPSVWKALSQWAVVHRPKCVCLPSITVSGEQAYNCETENNGAHQDCGATVGMWTAAVHTRWWLWFNIDAAQFQTDNSAVNSYREQGCA